MIPSLGSVSRSSSTPSSRSAIACLCCLCKYKVCDRVSLFSRYWTGSPLSVQRCCRGFVTRSWVGALKITGHFRRDCPCLVLIWSPPVFKALGGRWKIDPVLAEMLSTPVFHDGFGCVITQPSGGRKWTGPLWVYHDLPCCRPLQTH